MVLYWLLERVLNKKKLGLNEYINGVGRSWNENRDGDCKVK